LFRSRQLEKPSMSAKHGVRLERWVSQFSILILAFLFS
jgi:hypothetical protein